MDLTHVPPLPPVQEILKTSVHRIPQLNNVSLKYNEQSPAHEEVPVSSRNNEASTVECQNRIDEVQQWSDDKVQQLHHLNPVGSHEDEESGKSPSQLSLEERVSYLEAKCKCNEISKEIKLVQAELNIIADWIHSKFDKLLIDRTSSLYRSLHKDIQEVEDISKSLSMISKLPQSSKFSWNTGNGKLPGKSLKGVDRSRRATKKSKSSQQKSIFKGVLGTWINVNDCVVPNKSNNSSNSTGKSFRESEDIPVEDCSHVEIKEEQLEQDDSLAHDPFEHGYIPEVDEEGNVNVDFTTDDAKESNEGPGRPKRSSTRNVSYNGYLESDEEDVLKPGKGSPQKKREKRVSEVSGENSDQIQKNEDTNSKKKYKPSEASTVRAKILANTPMMCDECGKVVKGPWTLKAHKEMHANIRRYTCHVCGYAFRRKPHLNAHLLLHEGVKHLKCQYCGRGFYLRRDLARHERTHTGEKPYNCTFPNCTKSFNVKQHLTMHYRTHTGERPYKCPICEKSFSQANTLRIHKKLHEDGGGTSSTSSSSGRRKPRIGKVNLTKTSTTNESAGPSISFPTSSNGNKLQIHQEVHSMTSPSHSTSAPAVTTVVQSSGGRGANNTNQSPQQTLFRSPPPPDQENMSHLNLLQQQAMEPHHNLTYSSESHLRNNVVVTNVNSSTSSHLPFDILQQSWRQGMLTAGPHHSTAAAASSPGAAASVTVTNPAIFLPQIYEPLNIHFTSYPPPNSSSS